MSKQSSKTMIFHPISAPDFLPLEQLQALQLQRLQGMVRRAYDHVALTPLAHGFSGCQT